MRILHLSDTHVSAGAPGEVDATAALRDLLHGLRHLTDLDLVVVSGDIADDGSTEACKTVRDLVGAYAAERGVPHVYSIGNHDDRDAFGKVLGSGHLSADGTDIGRPALTDRCTAVSEVGGLRVITLDSLVPGESPGRLGGEQLAWLTDELATPASGGSIVVLHHPPVHPPSHPALADVGLLDGARLLDVIADSDVRAILCGHFHAHSLQLVGKRRVPVSIAPGVISRGDLTAPPDVLRAVVAAGASLVDLDTLAFQTLTATDPTDREHWSFTVEE